MRSQREKDMDIRQAILRQCRFAMEENWNRMMLGAYAWASERGISECELHTRELWWDHLTATRLNLGKPDDRVEWPCGITVADVVIRDVYTFAHSAHANLTPNQHAALWAEHYPLDPPERQCWWVTDRDWLTVLDCLVGKAVTEDAATATVALVSNSQGEKQLWVELRESGIQKFKRPSLAVDTSSPPSTNGSSPSS